jgi:putative protease
MKKTPELLLPAGSLEKMRYAHAYGADAVYAGLPRYSLRARNNDFRLDELNTAIGESRAKGKRLYITANLMAHNAKVKTFLADMAPVVALNPDALIMADPGLILMVRETWPEMPVHLSVQANTVNYASVRFWRKLGVSRIILSRELSLEEIAEIRQECPDIELEVFVHGALCIAYSGRCLLSGYFNHRDPNQGTCTNSCRWDYALHEAEETPNGDIVASRSDCGDVLRHPQADRVFLLEEGQRKDELMPIFEDELGTYILNSKDLRAIEHVARLVEIGIDSLKIEGRTKSAYYVARTAQAYRKAIDDAVAGRPFDHTLLSDLEGLANRGYTDGFYQRHHTAEHQNYLTGQSLLGRRHYVGDIASYDASQGRAEVVVKNRFEVGDRLEILLPSGNRDLPLTAMWNEAGEALQVAPGSGHRVWIPFESPCELGMVAKHLADVKD